MIETEKTLPGNTRVTTRYQDGNRERIRDAIPGNPAGVEPGDGRQPT